MANRITFTCTRLVGTNKIGTLKKDERGYYPVVVGALNMFNSAGLYYRLDAAREIFESQSSEFVRRTDRGALRGEYGHPRMLPGMTPQQYFQRLNQLWESQISHHFRRVYLDFNSIKDDRGQQVVGIMAEMCPNGPLGHVLEKQMQNPDENVCFSIRSFADDIPSGGVIQRHIRKVVTFDYVNEPGMHVAEKYRAPALEGIDDVAFTRGQVETAVRNMSAVQMAGLGIESTTGDLGEFLTALGWEESAQRDLHRSLKPSAWSNWR